MTTRAPAPDGSDQRERPVILLDLDGVVWLSHEPIAGSVEAIASLRDRGHRVLFVTNNSWARVEEQEASLQSIGIPAAGDVVTSALAGAALVSAGERVLIAGGPGIAQAVESRGAVVVDEGPADVVIVGFHRTFDYEGLRRAATAVMAGARLIGTNDDSTYPTPDGPIPGGGSILAAVRVASGVEPVVAGKPYLPMADLVRSIVDAGRTTSRVAQAVMVGDRPDTDGRFARALGCRYAQVWSGVTSPTAPVVVAADLVGDDLAAIAAQLLHDRA